MPSPHRQADEQTLIIKAQQGDSHAFASLYDQHVDAIYRYIAVRVADTQQVEDMTEEVFWKAWKAIKRYRPERPFLHWLYRIAHNLVVDAYHKDARHSSYEALAEQGQQFLGVEASPQAAVEQNEDVQQLRQALSAMSPEEQTLLSMRFFENASYEDIAPILGKSPGALRVLQHRALKKLATQLAPLRASA